MVSPRPNPHDSLPSQGSGTITGTKRSWNETVDAICGGSGLLQTTHRTMSSSLSMDSSTSSTSTAFDHTDIAPASPASNTVLPPRKSCDPQLLASGGWFAKCRGCGWMTSHEFPVDATCGVVLDIPCCKRCQDAIIRQDADKVKRLLHGLLYVHDAWSKAGL